MPPKHVMRRPRQIQNFDLNPAALGPCVSGFHPVTGFFLEGGSFGSAKPFTTSPGTTRRNRCNIVRVITD
jgi:hypothetical protein